MNGRRAPHVRTRRWFAGLGWVIIFSLLPCLAGYAAAQRNILLIIADDIGADSSSLYNTASATVSLPPTPTIESLAKRGVVFRNAWACPECSPTRASILTGRYPYRTGVLDALGMGDPPLSTAEFTLPKAFSNSAPNYHLAQFGKMAPRAGREHAQDHGRLE